MDEDRSGSRPILVQERALRKFINFILDRNVERSVESPRRKLQDVLERGESFLAQNFGQLDLSIFIPDSFRSFLATLVFIFTILTLNVLYERRNVIGSLTARVTRGVFYNFNKYKEKKLYKRFILYKIL